MKKFYDEYKYNIWYIIALIAFYININSFHISISDWRYILLVLLTIVLTSIAHRYGHREGRQQIANYLVNSDKDISVTVKKQKIYKLKDVPAGMFFSIVTDKYEIKEPLDKYLKLESNDFLKVVVWNMTARKVELIDNENDIIVYKCTALYTPKLEYTED